MLNVLQSVAHKFGLHVHRWPSARNLTIDYPVSTKPRWGYGRPPHPEISSILERNRETYRATLLSLAERRDLLASIPDKATASAPGWGGDNTWLPPLDASSLMHFLIENNPRNYIEIGSGTSTKFARFAIRREHLQTKITSIDPWPRAEINSICDEVIRDQLEKVDLSVFDRLVPNDIVFFDGSHRTFMDSDATVFFLEVLPKIRLGVLVQVHDIFWPFDYPVEWGTRFYSEQYLLGALILSDALDVVLPNHFIAKDEELSKLVSPSLPASWSRTDGSFWFRKRG